ncbi:hypothetical protein [Cupriavidus sp. UME77]|uniref:hypothetical protein n=1 Tax=Cupriavidus sp. UME77 TaxID=1862321 RepID=UPI001DB57593|nr:hypothetical protein [Cupriavidus sp. UME77]
MVNTSLPSQPASHPGSEAEVRALVDTRVSAMRAKDGVVMMRNYAEDVVIFDVAPPVHLRSPEARHRLFSQDRWPMAGGA